MRYALLALEYAGIMSGAFAFAVGWMFFWMEWWPAAIDTARKLIRIARWLLLAFGWSVVVVRLLFSLG